MTDKNVCPTKQREPRIARVGVLLTTDIPTELRPEQPRFRWLLRRRRFGRRRQHANGPSWLKVQISPKYWHFFGRSQAADFRANLL
jgi:hypothetical protein